MKKIMLAIILCCIIVGCGKDDDMEIPSLFNHTNDCTGNYLEYFIIPNSLCLQYHAPFPGTESWSIDIIPEDSTMLNTFPCSVNSVYSDEALVSKFKKYANYYGDTTYTHNHSMDVWQNVITAPLNSVSIVADQDFDEKHPAGTALDDFASISYFSSYNFIKNNYNYDFLNDSLVPIRDIKPISILGVHYSLLHIEKTPATPGKYTFTVTLDFGEDPLTGEKVTVPPASIEIEF